MTNVFRGIPFSQEAEILPNVTIARKENKGKSCLLFALIFAGFQKDLFAENLPSRPGGRAD